MKDQYKSGKVDEDWRELYRAHKKASITSLFKKKGN